MAKLLDAEICMQMIEFSETSQKVKDREIW